MKISKKWSAALAASLAVALVGAGTVSANAATGDPDTTPQPNGSAGAFYLFDENAVLAEAPGQVFDRAQFLFGASDEVDYLSEIDPDDYAAVGTWDTVYKFIAKPSELNGGTNTWRAFALDSAAGPNGGVLTPALTLGDLTAGNNGGIDTVFTEGGDWLVGLAFTTNAGVTPVGKVYRTVHVNAANDTYTYEPITHISVPVTEAPKVTTQPVSTSVTVGATATFTAAASGTPAPTVKWQSSADNGANWADVAGATSTTLTVPATTLAQSLTKYRAVFHNTVSPDATTAEVQLTVTPAPIGAGDEPTDADDAATKVAATSADGTVTLTGVAAGTYNAYAWSTPTSLGQVVVPASGSVTITVPAALYGTQHTVALFQPGNNALVVWGNVLVAPAVGGPFVGTADLSAEVQISGKFALEGVDAAVNLTPVAKAKRGVATAPVSLGAFTVTDDRNDLVGWNLNATATGFVNETGDTIPSESLGIVAKKVGAGVTGISPRIAKVAGDAWTSTLFAEGVSGSYTPEVGTDFDADLTFKAPNDAKRGTYHSTLTLTLSSKG